MQQIALRLAAGQTNLSPGRLCILANQGHYAEPPGRVFSFPTPTKQNVACSRLPHWTGLFLSFLSGGARTVSGCKQPENKHSLCFQPSHFSQHLVFFGVNSHPFRSGSSVDCTGGLPGEKTPKTFFAPELKLLDKSLKSSPG